MNSLSNYWVGSVVALLTTMALTNTANAQEINFGALQDEQANMVHVNTGMENAFVVGAGYSRIFHVADRPLVLTGDYSMPYARFDFSDFQLRVGAMVPIVEKKKWTLVGRATPILRGLKNDLARLTNVGIDMGLVGGYYSPKWYVAGEFGFDWAVSTYIKHTDEYRKTVYQNAKDGWYAPAGGNWYYGVQGGYSFELVDIILRVGQSRTIRFKSLTVPLYATLGVNIRFGDAK